MNGAFGTIEEIIQKMLYAMDGNEEFLKLIYIDKRSALTDSTPTITYKSLIGERLFPMERIEGPNEDMKSVVAIDWEEMSPSRDSDDIYNIVFTVDVYTCTDDSMTMLNDGELRVPRLAQIVYDSIVALELPTLSSDAKLTSARKMYYDNDRKFKGLRMKFQWLNPVGDGDAE